MRDTEKVSNINILRIIAASMVLILHYCAWQRECCISTTLLNFNDVLNSICFIAVPIFILISGSVLLRPIQETFLEFYRKRIIRIFLPLVFWTVFYLIIIFLQSHTPIKNLMQMTLRGKPFYHLWYMYMLIGLYFFTPFFRLLWNNLVLTQKGLLVGSILGMVWINQLADTILNIGSDNRRLFFNIFVPFIGLFFTGRLIAEFSCLQKNQVKSSQIKSNQIKSYHIISYHIISYISFGAFLVSLTSIALMGLSVLFPVFKSSISYTNIINNLGAVSFVYCFFSRDNLKLEEKKIVRSISNSSFCVYLLHPAILLVFPKHQLSVFQYFMFFILFFIMSWGFALLPELYTKVRRFVG